MPFEFKLPDLGEGIREAQVLAWKVAPGQAVAAFDPLCEVESAKAAVELTAPVAGRVMETRFSEGDIAHLGDVLVVIDTGTETNNPEPEWFGIVGTPPAAASQPVRAAPLVRKLARERGINLDEVKGSGPQGRVRVADLEDAATTTQPPHHIDRTPRETTVRGEGESRMVVPLRGLRKSIAEHMLEAWRHAPQVTSMDLLDVTELFELATRCCPRLMLTESR